VTSRTPPSAKELIAFKIGARARKFLAEGCPIEGYEVLLTALEEARAQDAELFGLLQAQMKKYEQKLETLEDEF
jgi:hypothetical protein